MKVLWFSNTPASGAEFLKSGGIGGGWLSSLDKALSDKVELHIAFYYPKYAAEFLYKGVYYHPICNKDWKWAFVKRKIFGSYIDREDLPVYIKLAGSISPDIIHIHGTENAFGAIIGSTKIPVVISIQGNITVYFHKFLSGIEKKYLSIKNFKINSIADFPFFESFKADFNLFSKLKKSEIRNLANCRYVIGRTEWDKRITRVLAPESTYFHSEEMLRDSFYNSEWKSPKNGKLILHTTNGNSPYKGFETLCQALNLLNKLGTNVEWRVAGIKDEDLIVKIVKRKLKKEYPTKGLFLLGSIQEKDLVQKLKEANIYVMPSHIENSPNNLCEAMILGMPCIASYAGGTGTILKDGKEGILVQDGDPWALTGAILELWNDYSKGIEYGQQARAHALLRHKKDSIVNGILNIYSTILEQEKKN